MTLGIGVSGDNPRWLRAIFAATNGPSSLRRGRVTAIGRSLDISPKVISNRSCAVLCALDLSFGITLAFDRYRIEPIGKSAGPSSRLRNERSKPTCRAMERATASEGAY